MTKSSTVLLKRPPTANFESQGMAINWHRIYLMPISFRTKFRNPDRVNSLSRDSSAECDCRTLKEKEAKSRPSAEHLHPPPSRPLSPPRTPLPERPCSHGIMSSNKRRADTYLTKEPQRNRPDEDIDRDRDAIDPVQRASAEVMATRKYRPQHLLIDNFHFGLFRWSGLTCC